MAEVNLPEGWCLATIGDVSFKGEQRIPAEHEQFIYVDIGSIDRNSKRIAEPQNLSGKDAPSRARKIICAGDVLVSLTRPNLNAVAIVTDEYDRQIASTGFEVVKPAIESRYIFGLVRSKNFVETISGAVQGALYPAAKSSDVQGYEFPLPPLAEQKIIAEKLDTLLAQVETTKARLERIPEIIKRFRQSVLAAAVSGRLTEEWRGSKFTKSFQLDEEAWKIPSDWNQLSLSEVIDSDNPICYGVVQPGDEVPGGKRLIRVCDINDGEIDFSDLRTISKEIDNQYSRSKVSKGDVLVTIVGAIGRIGIVRESIDANIARAVARLSPNVTLIHPIYLHTWLSSPALQWWLINSSKEVARKTLNLKELKEAPVALPSLGEQSEIVRRVEQLFAFANAIEQKANAALERVNNLTQSILAKAFRGELTADWRAANPELISGENSAEALLERIKAERAGNVGRKRR